MRKDTFGEFFVQDHELREACAALAVGRSSGGIGSDLEPSAPQLPTVEIPNDGQTDKIL